MERWKRRKGGSGKGRRRDGRREGKRGGCGAREAEGEVLLELN